MSYLVPLIAVVFVVVVGSYLASVPREEDQRFIIVILGIIVPLIIVAIAVPHPASRYDPKLLLARLFSASSALICNNEISFSAAARESCNLDIKSSLSLVSARRVSISTSMSSSLAITSSGLSSDVSDAGLPSEKVVVSGKNGNDGDLLLFRDSPGACDISIGTMWLVIYWESSRPVAGVKVNSSSGHLEVYLSYQVLHVHGSHHPEIQSSNSAAVEDFGGVTRLISEHLVIREIGCIVTLYYNWTLKDTITISIRCIREMSQSLSSNVPDNSLEQDAATGHSIPRRLNSPTSQPLDHREKRSRSPSRICRQIPLPSPTVEIDTLRADTEDKELLISKLQDSLRCARRDEISCIADKGEIDAANNG
ncbi:hypothetical protein Tco_0814120 [Tanacetum coccineum]